MSSQHETISSLAFIGTQSCMPSADRSTSCTAVVLDPGAEVTLVDCGEGTQRELMRASRYDHAARLSKISRVLLTHLHGDHCLGLPGLMCTLGQIMGAQAAQAALEIVGPPGTARLIRGVLDTTVSFLSMPYRVVELHGAWVGRESDDDQQRQNNTAGEGVTASAPGGVASYTNPSCAAAVEAGAISESETECARIAQREEEMTLAFRGPWHACEVPTLVVEIDRSVGTWTLPAQVRREDVPEFDAAAEARQNGGEEGADIDSGSCAATAGSAEPVRPVRPVGVTVVAAPICHRVPCVGYVFTEPDRTTIDADLAASLGVPPGPLLGKLRRDGSVQVPVGPSSTATAATAASTAKPPVSSDSSDSSAIAGEGEQNASETAAAASQQHRTVTLEQVSRLARGMRAAVLGDCSAVSDAMVGAMRGCDVLVHEATYGEDFAAKAPLHGHSTAATAARVAEACDAGRLVINHFSARYASDEALETLRKEAESVWYGGTVTAATDGMGIKLKGGKRKK